VPEALRAKEERANQDYVVAWVQGLWDFIQDHENDPGPNAKRAQDFDESKHPRDERGRFADRCNAKPMSKLESVLRFGKVTSKLQLSAHTPTGLASEQDSVYRRPETVSLDSRAGLHRPTK